MTAFTLDGRAVEVDAEDGSLLDALREHLGCRTPKDGCSPQGQCGCCTVLVDGSPRVACVTPLRRVAGRSVTTIDGLEPEVAGRWAEAFVAAGASQCGFCTPGIVLRLIGLAARRPGADEAAVRSALLAHLCRCTGWQSIVEAALAVADPGSVAAGPGRDPLLAGWRAELEGGTAQSSGPEVVLGRAGFADDRAPPGTPVALAVSGTGDPVPAPTLDRARRTAVKVQGRNSSVALRHPVALPPGQWLLTLQTTFVEPAYLEPDASWCAPGASPASPLANGGAFGGKRRSAVGDEAARLAAATGTTVRVLWPREEVVRRGPKRPPLALGLRADGTGVLRLATTPGSGDLAPVVAHIAAVVPGLVVELVAMAGPPVSGDLRGAGWAEALAALSVVRAMGEGRAGPGQPVTVVTPAGARATVSVPPDGPVEVALAAGAVLDPVTLRSYCLGAVHQALGLVRSEGIAVDGEGTVQDLTIRSFGILDARETPGMHVTLQDEDRWPVNGSDAVFAATLAAAWLTEGMTGRWPTRRATGDHR